MTSPIIPWLPARTERELYVKVGGYTGLIVGIALVGLAIEQWRPEGLLARGVHKVLAFTALFSLLLAIGALVVSVVASARPTVVYDARAGLGPVGVRSVWVDRPGAARGRVDAELGSFIVRLFSLRVDENPPSPSLAS